MSRDWQKDMEAIKYLQSWRLDPGGVEDGAAFYTIEKDGINTDVKADNMLIEDAWTLNDAFLALEYYHQQYAVEKERADKAEERESKLKWGYELMLSYVPIATRRELGFEGFLASLYPKEETKPAVLEEEEAK